MAKKQHKQVPSAPAPSGRDAPLVVWGERRADPDWDRFLAALIALALREADGEEADA